MDKFELRVTGFTVAPEGQPSAHEDSTLVEIADEGGGDFIQIVQASGTVRINPDEWPLICDAITQLVGACRG